MVMGIMRGDCQVKERESRAENIWLMEKGTGHRSFGKPDPMLSWAIKFFKPMDLAHSHPIEEASGG